MPNESLNTLLNLIDYTDLIKQKAEATAVQTPTQQTGAVLEEGTPTYDKPATLDVQPDLMSKRNEAFYDQTPEQQELARRTQYLYGYEAVKELGLEPMFKPHGRISGFFRNLIGGLTGKKMEPTEGSTPLSSISGSLVGEGLKYASIYKALPFGGFGADVTAGALSGAVRSAINKEDVLSGASNEAAIAGSAGAVLRGVSEGLSVSPQVANEISKVKPIEEIRPVAKAIQKEAVKYTDVVNVPTDEQALSLGFFGVTPDEWSLLSRSVEKIGTKWEGLVNKAANKVVEKTPRAIRNFVTDKFIGSAPSEVKNIFRTADIARERGKNLGVEIGNSIKNEIPKEYQFEAYKTLDPTAFGDMGDIPKEYIGILQRARNTIDDLGAQYVELGLLDEKTYAKNFAQYLSRYYKDKDNNLFGLFKFGRKQIKGRQLKHRTLETAEQRESAGLITDPAYAVARTIGDMTYDLEIAKAFRRVAQNPEWVSDAKIKDFVHVPPEPLKYGDIAGKWVDRGIWDEVGFIVPQRTEMGRLYDKLLGLWKIGKTAYNPATHGRNIFSNFVLADMGGLSWFKPNDIKFYATAAKEYVRKGTLYREAVEDGLLSSDWYKSEVKSLFGETERAGGSLVNNIFDRMSSSKVGRILDKPGQAYQAEEHFFKLAMYAKKRAEGMPRPEATVYAEKYLFNYNDLSPFLKKLRRSPFGGPFLSFTAKALPVMAETAVKHPFRFFKYYAGLHYMNEVSRNYLGMSDDEYRKMKNNLPEWQRNGFQVLLPVRDSDGNPVIWDLTYNMPWGDIGEQGNLIDVPVVGSIAERFIGGNPALKIPIELMMNKNAFTGKEIYVEGVDDGLRSSIPGLSERRTKQLSHIGKSLAPGIALNLPPVLSSLSGGKTKSGDELDPVVTALNKIVGLKFSSVRQKQGEKISASKYQNQIKDIMGEIIKVKLDESLSKEEQDAKIGRLKELIKDLRKQRRDSK